LITLLWLGTASSLPTSDILRGLEQVRSHSCLGDGDIRLTPSVITVFLGLSRGMRPDMGNKISGFIALGPAVYAGPVLRKFPFSLMRKFKARKAWELVFGGGSSRVNESGAIELNSMTSQCGSSFPSSVFSSALSQVGYLVTLPSRSLRFWSAPHGARGL
jgi:hypothetical protein